MTENHSEPFHIVFVLFDDLTQLDFTAAAQMLAAMPGAKVHTVSEGGRAIRTDCGFSILPGHDFDTCPQADLICVPGGFGVTAALDQTSLIEFVKAQSVQARYITSVCTGAFILAAAGLLRGKQVTTHWAYTDLLEKSGAIHVNQRIVRDGNIITAGGVTSGMDFALHIITEHAGEATARTIQLAMEYDPQPPYDGHPDKAPAELVGSLKERIYDDRVRKIGRALDKSI